MIELLKEILIVGANSVGPFHKSSIAGLENDQVRILLMRPHRLAFLILKKTRGMEERQPSRTMEEEQLIHEYFQLF